MRTRVDNSGRSAILRIAIAGGVIGCMALPACRTTPSVTLSQDTMDAINVCNAGMSISTRTRLNVNIAKVAQGNVGAEIAVQDEIVGKIAESLQVTEEQAVAFYKEYVACVQSKQSVKELLVILKSRAKVVEKNLTDDGYMDLVERFKELYPAYFTQLENGQAVAAYETYRSIQATLASAASRKSNGGDWSDMMQFRYNMSQNNGGRPMTSDEFDAWLKAQGIETKKGIPLRIGSLEPSGPRSNPEFKDLKGQQCPENKDACV